MKLMRLGAAVVAVVKELDGYGTSPNLRLQQGICYHLHECKIHPLRIINEGSLIEGITMAGDCPKK